jgi:hypothetical protein
VCAEGFYNTANGNVCLRACPRGFIADNTEMMCVPPTNMGGPVYGFVFAMNAPGVRDRNLVTTSALIFDTEGLDRIVTTHLWGGANRETVDRDDPFLSDDRGYYFDGFYHYLTFDSDYTSAWVSDEALSYSFWVQP